MSIARFDARVEYHGSVTLVRPYTWHAREFLNTRVFDAQWFGGALAVEPRYLDSLLDGMREEGLEILS